MSNAVRIIKSVVHRLGQRSARFINPAVVASALACFYAALIIANPNDPRLLADRYAQFPPHALPVPSVVSWPFEYLWMIAKPWFDSWIAFGSGHSGLHTSIASLGFLAAGAGLVVFANFLIWSRQGASNRDARVAVWVWLVSLLLNFFDLLHVAVLPETWDGTVLLGVVTFGGALRAAEVIASVYLLCCWRVLRNNRVQPHFFGPFAKIMNTVRRGLTYRGAVAVVVWPFAVSLAQPMLSRAGHLSGDADIATVIIEGGLLLLLLWTLFLGGIWRHLLAVAALVEQIIGMQPLIGQTSEPPSSPERY